MRTSSGDNDNGNKGEFLAIHEQLGMRIGLAQISHHMEHDDCFDCSVILEFDGSSFFDGPLDCFNHALGRYGVIQR